MASPVAVGIGLAAKAGRRLVPAAKAALRNPGIRFGGGVIAAGVGVGAATRIVGHQVAIVRAENRNVSDAPPGTSPRDAAAGGYDLEDAQAGYDIRQANLPSAGEWFADNWMIIAVLAVAALFLLRKR